MGWKIKGKKITVKCVYLYDYIYKMSVWFFASITMKMASWLKNFKWKDEMIRIIPSNKTSKYVFFKKNLCGSYASEVVKVKFCPEIFWDTLLHTTHTRAHAHTHTHTHTHMHLQNDLGVASYIYTKNIDRKVIEDMYAKPRL
jgi:hypothetical protein